jgi:hypothetical protein
MEQDLKRMVADLQHQVRSLTAQFAALSAERPVGPCSCGGAAAGGPDLKDTVTEFKGVLDFAREMLLECSNQAVAERLARTAMQLRAAESDPDSDHDDHNVGNFPPDLRPTVVPSTYADRVRCDRPAPQAATALPKASGDDPKRVSQEFEIRRQQDAAKGLLPYQPGQYQPIVRLFVRCQRVPYMEVRERLRKMGVPSGKVLDMIYHRQARHSDILELLVRESDRAPVTATMSRHGFKFLNDVTPDDPRLLDPREWQGKPDEERRLEAERQFRSRLERMLQTAKRPSVKGKLRNDLNSIRVAHGESRIPLSQVVAPRHSPAATSAPADDGDWIQPRRRGKNKRKNRPAKSPAQATDQDMDERLVDAPFDDNPTEPLAAERLVNASRDERDQLLGNRLFVKIQEHHPQLAGAITTELLTLPDDDLLPLLNDDADLLIKVNDVLMSCGDPTVPAVVESAADDFRPADTVADESAAMTDDDGVPTLSQLRSDRARTPPPDHRPVKILIRGDDAAPVPVLADPAADTPAPRL